MSSAYIIVTDRETDRQTDRQTESEGGREKERDGRTDYLPWHNRIFIYRAVKNDRATAIIVYDRSFTRSAVKE